MIVVSDTSSLYYAACIGCDHWFFELFEQVIVPKQVRDELLVGNREEMVSKLLNQPWLRVQEVAESPLLASLLTQIDSGEAEAISLAVELSADFLLIDERRGNAIAKHLHLHTVGLLGVFLLAKEKKIISEVRPWIERLVTQTKFRHTKGLIRKVLAMANEDTKDQGEAW